MADNNSSGAIVAIVAIVVIIGLAFFAFRMFGAADTDGGVLNGGTPNVDVNLGTDGQ